MIASLIEWKSEYATGIADVDHEHRELIDLINALYADLTQGGGRDSIAEFLGEINSRIGAHFALEEKIMRARHYDRYADHKADHERLLDAIRDIMDDYEDGALFDPDRLSQRLSDWFVLHFATHDARLHKHLG